MSDHSSKFAEAVRAIVDGTPYEWTAMSNDDPLLVQLRVLHALAQVHRDAPALEDRADATVGQSPPSSSGRVTARWAGLHLFEAIGQGSYGTVYRAWDSRLAREVAVKISDAGSRLQSSTLAEAQRLARVRHPHVVTIYGADSIDGRVGIWMERLDGQTLHELVQSNDVLSAREAALIGADVCSALAAVHLAGLLHRDIKPQNVVRAKGGRTVLMDFGAGREIDDNTAVDLAGTPLFMAPELFAGVAASAQSDLYGVGALLFFLTTGSAPVTASTLAEVREAHSVGAIRALRDVRPELPGEFVSIVERALSRDPRQRFASAGEMERALSTFVAAPGSTATGNPQASRVARPSAWRLPAWAVLPLVFTTAVATLVIGRVGRGFEPAATLSPPSTVETPVRRLSEDQFKIAQAVEELAASFASRGEWPQAIAQYLEAERLYRVNTSPDAPMVGAVLAKLAWAQQHAGQYDKALTNYEFALAKFQRWNAYPLMETTLNALATLHQAEGRYRQAIDSLEWGLRIRERLFTGRSEQVGGLTRAGVSSERLLTLMPSLPLDRDEDDDWLPDLLEVAAGLNPKARDSDHDGTSDADEDEDADHVSNWQRFGVTVDPSKMVGHFGGLDPEFVGFQQQDLRRIAGHATDPQAPWPAWRVPTTNQSVYFFPLTTAQRTGAMTRGWRLITRVAVQSGGGFLVLDLMPQGPRFDIEPFRSESKDFAIQFSDSIVPYGGTLQTLPMEAGPSPLVELEYDPLIKGAAVTVNGARWKSEPYRGHRQFQEGLGVLFGAHTIFGKVPAGEADFNLVMFVIR